MSKLTGRRKSYGSLVERLAANSIVDDDSGCWLWIGKLNWAGYAVMGVWNKKKQRSENVFAHRVALELKLGRELREGEETGHKCRYHHCIRQDHLEAVTRQQNTTPGARRNGSTHKPK